MRCIVELIGDDRNGRKMIAWGRRIGCGNAGHGYDPNTDKVIAKLLADSNNSSQQAFLLELADNPAGLKAMTPVAYK